MCGVLLVLLCFATMIHGRDGDFSGASTIRRVTALENQVKILEEKNERLQEELEALSRPDITAPGVIITAPIPMPSQAEFDAAGLPAASRAVLALLEDKEALRQQVAALTAQVTALQQRLTATDPLCCPETLDADT